MSDYFDTEYAFINSLIGEGTRFEGDLHLNGLLRIDGDFIGKVKNNGKVLIGKTGRAQSDIVADTVVIGGAFKGAIRCDNRVILLSSAVVIGTIESPKLIVEEGALLQGKFRIIRDVVAGNSTGQADLGEDVKDPSTYNPLKKGAADGSSQISAGNR